MQTTAIFDETNVNSVRAIILKFVDINRIIAASDEFVDVFYNVKRLLIDFSFNNVIVINTVDELKQLFTTIMDNVCLSHVIHHGKSYYERSSTSYDRWESLTSDHDPDTECESDTYEECNIPTPLRDDMDTFYSLSYDEHMMKLYIDSPLKTIVYISKEIACHQNLVMYIYHEAGVRCVNHCAVNLNSANHTSISLPTTLHKLATLITRMKIDKFSKTGNSIQKLLKSDDNRYTILMNYSY